MPWQHWSLLPRLLLGLLLAAVLLGGLGLLLGRPAPVAPANREWQRPSPPNMPALSVDAALVVLMAPAGDLPAAAAPVLQIAPDASVRVLRPPPLLPPLPPRLPARLTAVVRLPVSDLSRLDPHHRGALLECLGVLLRSRPVAPQRLLLRGVTAPPGELERLLTWVR